MEFHKHFHIGKVNIYVTTHRMKRRTGMHDKVARVHHAELRRLKVQRYRGYCEECGRPFNIDALQMHHNIPVSKRPDLLLSYDNIRLLCPECHARCHDDAANPVL